jgi:hypothetical protein
MSDIHFTPTELAEMHCVQNCAIEKDPSILHTNANPSQKIIKKCQEQCKNVSASPTSSSFNCLDECSIPFSKQGGCDLICKDDKAAGLELLSKLHSECHSPKCAETGYKYCKTNHPCGVTPAPVTTQGVTQAVVSAPVTTQGVVSGPVTTQGVTQGVVSAHVVTHKKDDIPMIVAGVVVGTLILVTIILLIIRRK